MDKMRLKVRVIWIAALFAAVFILLWLTIVPGGKITYITDFKGYNEFIGKLTPAERMDGYKIIGDPAYFSLRVPRRFESAKMTIKYKIDGEVPIVEAGVLKDKRTWQYDLRPLYNAKLEELFKKWNTTKDGDTIFLQRQKKYDGLADFLKNPPPAEKIALYNYDLNLNFTLPDYQPRSTTTTMCRPLQGTYQFYTYIKNENLSFDFLFQDLNKNIDPDPVDVYVYYRDQQISSEHLDDDGIITDAGEQKEPRHLKINLTNLPEGVYKIGVRANNDIVTRTIATPQSKITFINKVNLAFAPEVSCGRDLITDSRSIQFQTVSSDRLGTVKIIKMENSPLERGVAAAATGCVKDCAVEEVNISEAFKQFSTTQILPPLSGIIMPSDGIMVSGDGLFAFSQDQFFNPAVRKIDANFDADQEGIDYIIANYASPWQEDGWLVSQTEFDLQNVYKEFSKHSFIISIPGLRTEDNTGAGVEIGEIKMELTGTNLWEKIKKILEIQN